MTVPTEEAPSNYVKWCVVLVETLDKKTWLYAGTPEYPEVLMRYNQGMSDNPSGADNQQGSPLTVNDSYDPSETTRRAPSTIAYLNGALHDGCYNRHHNTYRYSQKDPRWLEMLSRRLMETGYKSWMYKEGKARSVYVLETSAKFLSTEFDPEELITDQEKICYIRGFFDAEGGIPRSKDARFYIQFSQKNQSKLSWIRDTLITLGVSCGKLHNPSHAVDPNYYRFYILAKSHKDFVDMIGTDHPSKRETLGRRMMI